MYSTNKILHTPIKRMQDFVLLHKENVKNKSPI
jgi:hypothetical protein